MKALIVKAIQFLLIARVVAAPVALRPTADEGPPQSAVVIRRCAWPAQACRITSVRITEGGDGPPRLTSPASVVPGRAVSAAAAADRPPRPSDDDTRRALWHLRC